MWGPSRLHPLGFIAHQASLTHGGGFEREKEKHISPRQRLLEIMDIVTSDMLPLEDRRIYEEIDRSRPWVLTPREISLLEKLQATKK